MSAHRTPALAADFAANARENGFGVIIAAAGKAAHLAGVLAAHTTLPVIGIPVKSSTLDGLDALLCHRADALAASRWRPSPSTGRKTPPSWPSQILALSDEALAAQLDGDEAGTWPRRSSKRTRSSQELVIRYQKE